MKCPACGREFGEDDINVRTDVAHCRGCGTDSSYAIVKGQEGYLKALHDSPPKNFTATLVDRGACWGDLKLAYDPKTTAGKWFFRVLAALLLVGGAALAVFLIVHGNVAEARSVAIACSVCMILLFCLAAAVQRTLEIEMSGGKGRVWTYCLFRGKGREFSYNGETNFFFHGAQGALGQTVMDKFRIETPGEKPLTVRVGMSESDFGFFQAALVYALPKDKSWFTPEPDRPETPEEAAIRRTEEAAEKSERRWATKWAWVRFFVIFALILGAKFAFRAYDRSQQSARFHAEMQQVEGELKSILGELKSRGEVSSADVDLAKGRIEVLRAGLGGRFGKKHEQSFRSAADARCASALALCERLRSALAQGGPDAKLRVRIKEKECSNEVLSEEKSK